MLPHRSQVSTADGFLGGRHLQPKLNQRLVCVHRRPELMSIHGNLGLESVSYMRIVVAAGVTLALLAPLPAARGAEPPAPFRRQERLDTTFPPDAILGKWWSEGKKGLLQIVKTKSGLYQVVVLDGEDADKKDVNNPDPKLRDRKIRGLTIMWHLRFEDGEYVDGYCYNPRDGNTYRVKMKILSPTSLRLRGYLAVPLLGQSQEWTRAGQSP